MAFYRFIVAVVLVSLAATVFAYEEPKVNDLILGRREYGDVLVLKRNLYKTSSIIGTKVKLLFESKNELPKVDHITQIRLLDRNHKGKGATAEIKSGGVYSDHVTIRLKSQRKHSINFDLEIYAKY